MGIDYNRSPTVYIELGRENIATNTTNGNGLFINYLEIHLLLITRTYYYYLDRYFRSSQDMGLRCLGLVSLALR